MAAKPNPEMDERVLIPLDPELAIRALLKVDPGGPESDPLAIGRRSTDADGKSWTIAQHHEADRMVTLRGDDGESLTISERQVKLSYE